jgi:hypothetical protein
MRLPLVRKTADFVLEGGIVQKGIIEQRADRHRATPYTLQQGQLFQDLQITTDGRKRRAQQRALFIHGDGAVFLQTLENSSCRTTELSVLPAM